MATEVQSLDALAKQHLNPLIRPPGADFLSTTEIAEAAKDQQQRFEAAMATQIEPHKEALILLFESGTQFRLDWLTKKIGDSLELQEGGIVSLDAEIYFNAGEQAKRFPITNNPELQQLIQRYLYVFLAGMRLNR